MECDAEKLLVCIEKRPAIYNFNLKDHSNRGVVDKLWEDIAAEMDVTVAECKAKWTSLRNSYNRQLREGKHHSSGSEGSKKRKWYLLDAMEFLHDFVGVHRRLGSYTADAVQKSEFKDEQQQEQQQHYKQYHEDANNTMEFIPNIENAPLVPCMSTSQSCRKKTPTDREAEPMTSFFKSRTERPETTENSTLCFFKSLVEDVDKLSDGRKRKFKLDVMSLLDRYLEEQESA
ncbi:uncharacterized protein [Periplaneta americana]|uniref:uncharacterized protein n=1 Tax=Periplaneta americana TaxID=6978 RepID=UPI0037E8E891